jgi:hypothetical protein
VGLTETMTETEFDNGYWYVAELKEFARRIGMAGAGRLRKDELEKAIRQFIRTGQVPSPARRGAPRTAPRDVDLGLRPDLPVVRYTSDRETNEFIEREARKIDPGFTRKSGTRYLLNRWREEQVALGRPITYADLVRQALTLNEAKQGPLRLEHGRYINFISDFLAANGKASRQQAVEAWQELKTMDVPKTYQAWLQARR